MALKVSQRGKVSPFIVMDVLRSGNRLQAQGKEVFHLELGQPSTPAPKKVINAALKAANEDAIGYTEALGRSDLREKISEWYWQRYQVQVPRERIVVTTGSSGGFVLAFLAAFDQGDRVALGNPSYPAYRNILRALGITPVGLETSSDARFQLTPQIFNSLNNPVDGLILASPANPTGCMIEQHDLERMCVAARRRSMRLVSDEIYHGICFDFDAQTALKYDENAIIINSFSKYFCMTGWRVGWMIVPEALVRSVECLAQNMYISAPTMSQIAATAAFDSIDELEQNVFRYKRNRTIILNGLIKMGLRDFAPVDGAFYIYVDVSKYTNDSETFCRDLLLETGVAATPGKDFDPLNGNKSIRLSFSGDTMMIKEAVERLGNWLAR
ncbi:MAG: aminotransferase class I/II-fold pyridoxal phosphate-dependent enzyme [Pseudomonadota bacterium]|nr:aminotransferase class I/II-fold pyridoxal phosphate-dependent enzyme [Pseudomonadota bacterium]